MSASVISATRSMWLRVAVCGCLCLTAACGPAAPALRIDDVSLNRSPPGHTNCDVLVKVSNLWRSTRANITVQGQIRQFDTNQTVNTLDASDFGGTSEIPAASVEADGEKTFVGRSVTIAPGIAATYRIEIWQSGKLLRVRDSKESVITCAA
jgi:hypothetical protein